MTWWINTDSIQIDPAAVLDAQRPLAGVFTLIMMMGVLSTAFLMIMQRRGDHGVSLLLGAIKYVAISTLSIVVLQGALGASDEVAQNLINNGSEKFGDNLAALLGIETLVNPALILVLGLICGLLALIQWVFGFIREAGILVLAVMLGIAAAGQLSTWGRQWFPRLASSLVALILYKPMAALIFNIGFRYMGQGKDLATVVTGIMVVALAVVALPAMMKFFSFVGAGVGGGGSGMALAAAGAGLAGRAMAGGGGDSGGGGGADSATSVANQMEATGPGTGVTDTPPGPGEGDRVEAPAGGPGADADGGESDSGGGGGGGESGGDTYGWQRSPEEEQGAAGQAGADETGGGDSGAGGARGETPGGGAGEDTADDGVGAGSPDVGSGVGGGEGGGAAAAGGEGGGAAAAGGEGAAAGGAGAGAAAAGPAGLAVAAGSAALDKASEAADSAASTMQGDEEEDEK